MNEACSVITTHLLRRFVEIPSGECLDEDIAGFEQERGFPLTVGAIDGTHIPIICPKEGGSDYYNHKGFYSVIMQAIVDCQGLFIDMYTLDGQCA